MIGRWIFIRDGRLSGRTKLVLAVLFLLAMIALVPLRLVVANVPGLTARSVDGPAWSGTIRDLRAGPLPLGDVDAGLLPLPLLIGRPEMWIARHGTSAAPFAARAAGGEGWLRLSRVNGTVPLADGMAGLPVASASFTDFALRMEGGKCVEASGTASLTLSQLSVLLPDAIAVSGQARCEGGALLVPMQGAGGMEHLTLRVQGSGAWTADLALSGLPAEVSGPLVDMGFSARPGGIGFRASGQF